MFYFCLCAYGSETALRDEISSLKLNLKPGFFKKGFLTFSSPAHLSFKAFENLTFAYFFGETIEVCKNLSDTELQSKIIELKIKHKLDSVYVTGREKKERQSLDENWSEYIQKCKNNFENFKKSKRTLVLVYIEENEVCFGIANTVHSILPEDVFAVKNKIVSRAYFKAKESCLKFNISFDKADILIELGSAPGGSCQYYLEQNIKVIGVDPSEMDKSLLKNKSFLHIQKTSGQLLKDDLPADCTIMAMDMNVKPEIAFLELRRALMITQSAKLALLTFKLPKQVDFNAVTVIKKRLEKLKFKDIVAKQLMANRQEIFFFARR